MIMAVDDPARPVVRHLVAWPGCAGEPLVIRLLPEDEAQARWPLGAVSLADPEDERTRDLYDTYCADQRAPRRGWPWA